ncbi:MAG: class I SAM-dependent methyltransferase [Chitinophagaceae bacterium]|jgi:predicted O-methyltransferase YrrM
MRSIIEWFKYKGWFIFDLPYFIKEKQYTIGLELGAKGGRSMYYMLKENKNLNLTGIDLWENLEGSAYKNNQKNEFRCKRKLRRFSDRTTLIKGDAKNIVNEFPDSSFDFIYYDLQCRNMLDFHHQMISLYLPKIKNGGILIGRDFRQFRETFYNLGFEEEDFLNCKMGERISPRLEYLVIKK